MLSIAAPVALLASFVPYSIGGLLAGYGQTGGDGGEGGGPGGFAGYGIVAILLGVGIPGWAVAWGIVDARRTGGIPGAALLLGVVSMGIALCVIVPGSVTIIRTSATLQAAYEREHPRSEVPVPRPEPPGHRLHAVRVTPSTGHCDAGCGPKARESARPAGSSTQPVTECATVHAAQDRGQRRFGGPWYFARMTSP